MKIEQAAEIRFLLNELDRLNHIKAQTEEAAKRVKETLRKYHEEIGE